MSCPRILIVDDDPSIRGLLRVIAKRTGTLADEAADGFSALELIDRHAYDVVLLDLAMPLANGFDLIEGLRQKSRRPAVFVLSAMGRHNLRDLDPSIVHCVVRKPFDVDLVTALMVSAASGMWRARDGRTDRAADRDHPEARI